MCDKAGWSRKGRVRMAACLHDAEVQMGSTACCARAELRKETGDQTMLGSYATDRLSVVQQSICCLQNISLTSSTLESLMCAGRSS